MSGCKKEMIYQIIQKWQDETEVDFIEYCFDISPLTFMSWCLGKGYQTSKKYNLWVEAYTSDDFYKSTTSKDACSYMYNWQGEYGEQYAVIVEDDWTDKGQEKIFKIIAEITSEIDVYQARFKNFMLGDGDGILTRKVADEIFDQEELDFLNRL